MSYFLADLNQMDQTEFTQALGDLFEQTPLIVSQTWPRRPFADLEDLHQALVKTLMSLSVDQQLDLIRAHPDLGTKAKMADASVQEQASVGLNALSPEDYDRFSQLNQAYRERFAFPFIIAVRHHTQATILAAFEQRLQHTQAIERQTALEQIAEIVRLRLLDRVTVSQAPESMV